MVLKSALICFSPQFIREPKMEVLFFTSLHLMVRIASASNSFSLKTWPSQQHMGIFQYITFCSPWDTSVVTRTKVTLYPQNWNWISIYFWKFAQNDILFVRSIFFFFSLSNTLQTCCWKILKWYLVYYLCIMYVCESVWVYIMPLTLLASRSEYPRHKPFLRTMISTDNGFIFKEMN